MVNIDAKLNELKNYFKSNNNILAAWFTGSYGTKNQREDSDIDIALLFDKQVGIMEEIFNKYRDEKYYLDRFMYDFYESYKVNGGDINGI